MHSRFPYRPLYPYSYSIRQTIVDKILACHKQNRWIRLTFRDGTNIEGFLNKYDLLKGALVYVPMRRYSITCNGVSLDYAQKVQNYIGKTAILTLPNNISLSFKINSVDQHGNIGGWFNLKGLSNMSAQVADVNCL